MVENWTNYDHIRTCFVYGGGVMPGRRAGSGVVKYNAESPKQAAKGSTSLQRRSGIFFIYALLFKFTFVMKILWTNQWSDPELFDTWVVTWECHLKQIISLDMGTVLSLTLISVILQSNQGFGAGAGVFGWSRSRHFGPAPAPPYIFVK